MSPKGSLELDIEQLHTEELGNRFSATANTAVKPG
jgi:hypothetical protein